MRVAIVLERMEAWRGGAETSTLQVASALRARGVDVHLITSSWGQPVDGMVLHMLPSWPLGRTWQTHQFVERVRDLAKAEAYDVLHAVAPCPGANIYQPRGGTVIETAERNLSLQPASRRGWKRLMNRFNLRQQLLRWQERRMLAASVVPQVVALSDYVVRQVQGQYHVPPERLTRVFNGVDVRPLQPRPESLSLPDPALPTAAPNDASPVASEPPTTTAEPPTAVGTSSPAGGDDIRQMHDILPTQVLLLHVAHNFKLKGVSSSIAALGRLKVDRPAVLGRLTLAVIGRDDPRRYLAQAQALGVAEHVRFVGSTQRMAAFYLAADVLVHPTWYDPCSRVVLEALACGLPCITTQDNGASEVMTHGAEGCVIDHADNIVALSDAITFLADDQTRRACARAALKLRQIVSIDRHIDDMLRVYEQVCTHGPTVAQTLAATQRW